MIELNGSHLTLKALHDIARNYTPVFISEQTKARILKARKVVRNLRQNNKAVYGINTGFGKLSNVMISQEKLHQLQSNLVRSHACGTGEPFSIDIVRAMMALRINALSKGYSGIRLVTLMLLIQLLNENIIPVVYTQGSLGASGDLVPLAHIALVLIGEGEVWYEGTIQNTKEVFDKCHIEALDALHAKEGLALINGTQAMVAVGALTLYDAYHLTYYSSLSGALSFEALNGITEAFDARVQDVRNQEGQIKIASVLRKLLEGSSNVVKQCPTRVQDAYSLRCMPQVHGASLDAFNFVHQKVVHEMNAVTDNPIIFPETNEAISAGNFHGQPVAMAFDFMKIALSELANISERRIERLVNPQLNSRYPAFLVKEMGLNSGFMIVQYAAASLVSENKVLAHPASVDSIPSSANQEDHVSMGTIAARHANMVLNNCQRVIALELFTACQALSIEGADKLSPALRKVYDHIRQHIPFITQDEVMYKHMNTMHQLLLKGALITNDIWEDLL